MALRRNTVILLLNNLLGSALGFLVGVVIGRELGAEGLGQYTFILAWVVPLTTFADFGIGSLITRDVARDKQSAPGLIHAVTRTFPILTGAALLIAWALVFLSGFSPVLTVGIMLAALLAILDPWYGVYTALFRAFERMTPTLYLNVIGLLVQLGLTILAIRSGAGVIGAIGALVVVNAVQWLGAWLFWRLSRERRPYQGQASPTRTELIRKIAPFALSSLITALGIRTNIFLLERLSGDAAVGYYSAANRFVEAGRMVPNAFFGALFPVLSAMSGRHADRNRLIQRAVLRLTALCVVMTVIMGIGASLLLRITYGERFISAAPLLRILAISLVPSVLRSLFMLNLYSTGREALANRISLAGLAAQAVVSAGLITAMGSIGAAWSLLIVETGLCVFVWSRVQL